MDMLLHRAVAYPTYSLNLFCYEKDIIVIVCFHWIICQRTI